MILGDFMNTHRTNKPASIRILVVDDEEAIREIFQMGISQSGYECLTASSGIDALTLLKKTNF